MEKIVRMNIVRLMENYFDFYTEEYMVRQCLREIKLESIKDTEWKLWDQLLQFSTVNL